jgi:anti-sigma factor ChrR (cupin superfamily)
MQDSERERIDRLADDAAGFLLELNSEAESLEFRRRLESQDPEAEAALREVAGGIEALAAAAPAHAPPPELRARLLARVAREEAVRPQISLRAGERDWRPTGVAGIAMQLLYADPTTGRHTLLLRLDPGARYPAHLHDEAEQCLVLEGEVGWEELRYAKGDFIVAGKGSVHPVIETTQGALLLLVAGHSEFV